MTQKSSIYASWTVVTLHQGLNHNLSDIVSVEIDVMCEAESSMLVAIICSTNLHITLLTLAWCLVHLGGVLVELNYK